MKSDIQAESDEWRRHRGSHKDTSQWCRGHIGVVHEPTVVEYRGPLHLVCGMARSYRDASTEVWHCAHQVKCVECGKLLEALPADDCPERV